MSPYLNLGQSSSNAHFAPSGAPGSPPGQRRPPVSNPGPSFHPAHSIQTPPLTPPPPGFSSGAAIPQSLTCPVVYSLRPELWRWRKVFFELHTGRSSSGVHLRVARHSTTGAGCTGRRTDPHWSPNGPPVSVLVLVSNPRTTLVLTSLPLSVKGASNGSGIITNASKSFCATKLVQVEFQRTPVLTWSWYCRSISNNSSASLAAVSLAATHCASSSASIAARRCTSFSSSSFRF